MSTTEAWPSPPVSDADITWASELMGLGSDGFAEVDGDTSRLTGLRNMGTADFEAGPGSGKTTLLVAKLAILAKHWKHPRQGICVLSHTNAARNEIGLRLGASPVAGALLRYPHFVGTIHSFVNEYLAIPWLRSKGNPIKAIDDDLALSHRMGRLGRGAKFAMKMQGLTESALRYVRNDYTAEKTGKLTAKSAAWQEMVAAAKASSEAGYFCFNEMFVWANELLDSRPEVVQALRHRFPFVFIDEAQDNEELQSALLHRLFIAGPNPSRRQRFGDSNQAIYSNHNIQAGASTDPFPGAVKFDLPRSYRFGQEIADQVKGLGVTPQPLIGAGPRNPMLTAESKTPTLFLFDDASVREVLPRYAAHLIDEFSDEELVTGTFVAVAGVHKPKAATRIPFSMADYAPTYNATTARRSSQLASFADYLARAKSELRPGAQCQDTFGLVQAVAAAILRFASLTNSQVPTTGRRSQHRHLIELLGEDLGAYHALLELVVSRRGELSTADWEPDGRALAISVATAIAGTAPTAAPDAQTFLNWPEGDNIATSEADDRPAGQANRFSYPPDEPRVHVRLGSIHSVKGETHTATLVLESFFHKHQLAALKPWLMGQRTGGLRSNRKLEGIQQLQRLRLHYVAATRPSHLLCLAMRKDAFEDEEIKAIQQRGWIIVNCCSAPV